MILPELVMIRYRISDLNEKVSTYNTANPLEMRKKVDILIIDDNEFEYTNLLRKSDFSITYKSDIDSMVDIKPYTIILCDISGVGKNLGYEKEGGRIISEIHKIYPTKIVVAYSANTFDAEYNQFFSQADSVAKKEYSLDNWIELLDTLIEKALNPVKQWEKIRDYLIKQEIATFEIAKIESKYVASVKKKDWKILNEYLKNDNSSIKSILMDFTSSVVAKLILGMITG